MLEASPSKTVRGLDAKPSSDMNCVLGISIDHAQHNIDELQAAWSWTAANFYHAAILVGDSLYPLTLQIQSGIVSSKARSIASAKASALWQSLRRFSPVPIIIRTSEIMGHPSYFAAHERFTRALRERSDFSAAIKADASSFCERQRRRGALALPEYKARALTMEYLVREVALYECLVRDGWCAETYVGGELPTLAKFMAGAFPALSPALEQRVHISLRIRELEERECLT